MSRTGIPAGKRAAKRGQPLLVLTMLLFAWVAARAAVWEMPDADAEWAGARHATAGAADRPRRLARALPQVSPSRAASATKADLTAPHKREEPQPALQDPAPKPWPGGAADPAPPTPLTTPPTVPLNGPLPTPSPLAPRVAAGHQMLWLAAVARLPLPSMLFDRRDNVAGGPSQDGAGQRGISDKPVAVRDSSPRRWSGDGWLLLRRGETGPARNGFAAPSYGASQIGAVLRYRLAPGNARKPSLYLRAAAAVRTPHDAEVAAGLSARLFSRIPLVAMAEIRASRPSGAVKLRPAAALVSEFPPLDLPHGLRAEAYAQAGYVGGDGRGAFADGQLHLLRRIARIGGLELRAGGAAWGGAQSGASRVDIGPSASLGLPIGPANARVSADWRFRIAGSAVPGSGPAVTLSAGF